MKLGILEIAMISLLGGIVVALVALAIRATLQARKNEALAAKERLRLDRARADFDRK
ncbi:hypothetical protein [Polaromonas sp. YR568]|uniref:hypothetical protein n=1 Tax=Polaromonas sp. YR568 TaxID=1855301 RepID=UPI001587D627|nr:hypothetical protein [Polaromonas sp. YR568]